MAILSRVFLFITSLLLPDHEENHLHETLTDESTSTEEDSSSTVSTHHTPTEAHNSDLYDDDGNVNHDEVEDQDCYDVDLSRVLLFVLSLLFALDHEENYLHVSVNSSSVENLSNESTTSLTEAHCSDLLNYDDDGGVRQDGDEDQYDDVDEEDWCYDDEDLDDEFIPRSVSKKVKKQRLCKLGRRTLAKIQYTQQRRGCMYGKHGLGIRFRC